MIIKKKATPYSAYASILGDSELSLTLKNPAVTSSMGAEWESSSSSAKATIKDGGFSAATNGIDQSIEFDQLTSIKSIGMFVKPASSDESLFELSATIYAQWVSGALSTTGFTSPLEFTKVLGDWVYIGISQSTGLTADLVAGYISTLTDYGQNNYFNVIMDTNEYSNDDFTWLANNSGSTLGEICTQLGTTAESLGGTADVGVVGYFPFNDIITGYCINLAKPLGDEESSGTCTLDAIYLVTATETEHFGTDVKLGDIFTSDGTETLDASNKVKEIPFHVSLGTKTMTADTWFDSSGNDLDGAVSGAKVVPAIDGRAYEFDGDDDNIDLGSNPPELEFGTKPFCIIAKTKVNLGNEDINSIFRNRSTSSPYNGYALNVNDGISVGKYVFVCDGGTQTDEIKSSSIYNDGLWHVVSVLRDGINLKMVVDGESAATPVTDNKLDITANANAFISWQSESINGNIAYIFVFNTALTQSEIQGIESTGIIPEEYIGASQDELFSAFTNDSYDTFTSSGLDITQALATSGAGSYDFETTTTHNFVNGKTYQFDFVVAGTLPVSSLFKIAPGGGDLNGAIINFSVALGENSITWECNTTGAYKVGIRVLDDCDYSISNFSARQIGCVLNLKSSIVEIDVSDTGKQMPLLSQNLATINNGDVILEDLGNDTDILGNSIVYKGKLNFDGINSYALHNTSESITGIAIKYEGDVIIKNGATYYVNGVVASPSVWPYYESGDDRIMGKSDATTFHEGAYDSWVLKDVFSDNEIQILSSLL